MHFEIRLKSMTEISCSSELCMNTKFMALCPNATYLSMICSDAWKTEFTLLVSTVMIDTSAPLCR